jgi:hypothetical protein
MISSGITSSTPALRVAAASPPTTPASGQRPIRAAYIDPTDVSRKSASEYTADSTTALGNQATMRTTARAASVPKSIATSRWSRYSPPIPHADETKSPSSTDGPSGPPTDTSAG